MSTIAGSVILHNDPRQSMTFEPESDITVKRRKTIARKYSDAERAFLKAIVPGRSYSEIAELFNSKFEESITASQVNAFIGNNKLNTGLTGRFAKGNVPFNKGKKGVGGWEPTQFKKGNVPVNHRPVGSERVDADGYTWVKVAEPNKWRMKHVLVWESANGPIPKGYVLIFGDSDRSNFTFDNLVLVSRSELLVMNRRGLITNDAELTKSGVIIADIYMRMSERRKKHHDRQSN